ncbi:glutamine-serine-proline rich protein [Diplodia corticola]|uniref:Glutamine-serine-proline rich protein n=1 Tax=Diplodia corticola TaxID=236234 RepID=A0A1J9R4X5_9PEZI|nr:glutamine-serine-proline rich protein [Diplodia corticola]OJD35282.1 glutamine-serine-proline rich protein [Diplodia corticola]
MSFTKSSRDISVTSDLLLSAECKQISGHFKRSFVQLDPVLGNADGSFHVEGRDFSKSARNVGLKVENGSAILHASLRKMDGSWQDAAFNLDVIVANRNGSLVIDMSTIQSPDGAVTCDTLETLVDECRQAAEDLKNQIRDQLTRESHGASQSVHTAFKGIAQMQEALNDGAAYADREDFRPEAGHLGFLLSDATGQWSKVEDAVGSASQNIKDFQSTKLHDVIAEIEAAERNIAAKVDSTMLEQKETKIHLESLGDRISQHQEELSTALNQRHEAAVRTISFSIASVLVPFIFIPLAVEASGERAQWDKQATDLENAIRETSCLRDRLDGLQIGLERSLQAANQVSGKCRRLRADVDTLSEELHGLEERIREKKCMMAEYVQTLREAESDGVTALEYSQTLQEGREILQEVLYVRQEFDPEKLHVMLQL